MLNVSAKHGFRRDLGYWRALLNQSAYLSSLAMSPCCESSSISGKLVMMSRWISTGATDTSCISLLPKSCTHAWTRYATQMSCQHTQGWYTKQSRANLFNGFYLFIGAILPNIVHVCIRFKILACWQYDTELIHEENICSLFHYFVCTKDAMVRGAAVREGDMATPINLPPPHWPDQSQMHNIYLFSEVLKPDSCLLICCLEVIKPPFSLWREERASFKEEFKCRAAFDCHSLSDPPRPAAACALTYWLTGWAASLVTVSLEDH